MEVNDLVKIVAALPEARKVSTEEAYWRNVVPNIVPLVLDEVLMAHDWDFTVAEYSSDVSVADHADYIIRGGNANDCRDIISVRYGSDEELLTHYRSADMDEIKSNDQDPTSVFGWTQFSRSDDGYPIITIHSTPGTAGETLKIRYRKKDVSLQKYPDDFGYVLALGVVGWLLSSKRRLFDRELKRMTRRYSRGGKDMQITPISIAAARSNNEIADTYGSG